jgi:hypothetical protein
MPFLKSTTKETEEWNAKKQMWVPKKKKPAKQKKGKKIKLKEAYGIRTHRKNRRAMIDSMLDNP